MRVMIEFCNGNRHHGTESLILELENREDCDAIVYGCLGNCGECFAMPFAMVEGQIKAAESVELLREHILTTLEEDETKDPFADLPYLD